MEPELRAVGARGLALLLSRSDPTWRSRTPATLSCRATPISVEKCWVAWLRSSTQAPIATAVTSASATMALRSRVLLPGCGIRAAVHPYLSKCYHAWRRGCWDENRCADLPAASLNGRRVLPIALMPWRDRCVRRASPAVQALRPAPKMKVVLPAQHVPTRPVAEVVAEAVPAGQEPAAAAQIYF